MNFQNLPSVMDPEFYLDVAFRAAKQKVRTVRLTRVFKSKIEKLREIEKIRIKTVSSIISRHFKRIITSYPNIDKLPAFYLELVKSTLDYVLLKRSLASLGWVIKKSQELSRMYNSKIAKCEDSDKIGYYRREFYGRVSSLVKQLRRNLQIIENARKVMKDYPTVKTSAFTVVITGLPNVGKTTLLYKLTGSMPEINSYPFTTKGINIGYLKYGTKKVQLLDTPGSLTRNRMNKIEKQAYLAVKYCADLIIYVFDLTCLLYTSPSPRD